MTAEEIIGMLAATWEEIDKLCSGLTEEQWTLPSMLPRWSVKDIVSHVTAVESMILGRQTPAHDLATPIDLPNPIAEFNEKTVDFRRTQPGAAVLAEFDEVAHERLTKMRAMTAEEFAADSWTPFGPGTFGGFMETRIVDDWVHAFDLHQALHRPLALDSVPALRSRQGLLNLLPRALAKKAQGQDGTSIVFACTRPAPSTTTVTVVDGRGVLMTEGATQPTVRLTMNAETLLSLLAGRGDGKTLLDAGAIAVEGDADLALRVVRAANVMF